MITREYLIVLSKMISSSGFKSDGGEKPPMSKNHIKKILVPLDGSKSSFNGLDEAIYLARQCHATITGLHIIPVYPKKLGDLVSPLKITAFDDATKMMNKAEVTCAQNGILFHKKVVIGDVKSDISTYAKQNKFDIIVLGARGLGAVKEMFLGSVSNAVVHKSKVPVLLVK